VFQFFGGNTQLGQGFQKDGQVSMNNMG